MSEEIVKTEKKRKASSKNGEEVSSRVKTTAGKRRKTASDPAEQTPKKKVRRKSAKAENKEKTAEPKKNVSRKKKAVNEPVKEPEKETVRAAEEPKYTVEYRTLEIADTYAQAMLEQEAVLPEKAVTKAQPETNTEQAAEAAVIATAAETAVLKAAEEPKPDMPEPEQDEKPAEDTVPETEDTPVIFPEEKPADEVPVETEEVKAEPAETSEETPEQPEATEPEQEEKPAEDTVTVTEELPEEKSSEADTTEVQPEEITAAESEKTETENVQSSEAAEETVRTDQPAEVFPDIPRKKSLFKRKQANTIELSVDDLNKAITEKNIPKSDSSLILMTDLNLPLLKVLFLPVWTAERYRHENKTPGSSALFAVVLKWAMAFFGIVWFMYQHLNEEAFSYARMTFTDASWVWFRYVFIGFISEYLCIWLITAVYKPNDPHISYRRVRMMATAPDFLIGVLYLAAGLLLNVSFAGGCILFIAATAVSPVLHDLCFVYTKGYPAWKKVLTVYVSGLITAVLFILFTKYFAGDLIKIFEAVVNL